MPEPKFRSAFTIAAGALSLLALVSGCHIGPAYHAPAPPAVTAPNYKESTVNFHDADGWKVASPQDAMLRGNWWEVFNDPELNALEEQLNINNQNLKEYFQNYMAARAQIAAARSQYWPTVTANPSWNRSKDLRQPARILLGHHRNSLVSLDPAARCFLDARSLGQDPQRSP